MVETDRVSAEGLREAAQRLSDTLFKIYDHYIDREYPWEADWKALRAALRSESDRGIDVDARDEAVRRAMLYVMQMSDEQLRAFAPVALIRALEQDGYTVVRLSTPETSVATPDRADLTDRLEDAIQAAYDEHDDHRMRHPGHSGTCQDDWPSASRLAPLVARALATPDRDDFDPAITIREKDLRDAWLRLDAVGDPRTAHTLWQHLSATPRTETTNE